MNTAEITITWYNGNPIGFWFNDEAMWESDVIANETDGIGTIRMTLPVSAALKLSSIFVMGLTADRLLQLLVTVNAKVEELKRLNAKIKASKDKQDDNLLGWDYDV